MSSVLHIDGKEYVTATTAGKHFGYTKDYMLLLAKEGKIDGQKIGHKWYIHIPTAELFFASAEKSRKERQEKISRERKSELSLRSQKKVPSHLRQTALVETLAVVVIGLSLGVTGYLGNASQKANVSEIEGGFFKHLAISLYEFISPRSTSLSQSEKVSVPVEINETEIHTKQAQPKSLIVAPAQAFTEDAVRSVQESFSDEVRVEVDAQNPDTGIIIPQFKSAEGEAYRFLLVPLEAGRMTPEDSNGVVPIKTEAQ